MCIYKYKDSYLNVCLSIYIYIYIYIYTSTYIYKLILIYIHVNIQIYIYIHILKKLYFESCTSDLESTYTEPFLNSNFPSVVYIYF
jgi:hypothetical protein